MRITIILICLLLESIMNKYRDYYLKDINKELVDKKITVSGWVNRSRDHGNLLFIDLRD